MAGEASNLSQRIQESAVPSASTLLSLRGLRKGFGSTLILDDFALDVSAGERLVIVGPSGSGKSTLLRCIMGLEHIDGGAIFFEGGRYIDSSANGTHTNVDKKKQLKIGMVFQHYTLFPHLTILKNLTLAPTLVRKTSKQDAAAMGTELLARFNLEDKANEYPAKLSGGQKQRAAIARALMMNPKLMLFDEVTSALDPELMVEVMNTMLRLAEQTMTMIIVTHEMDFAKRIATRVLFLDHGRIVEQGLPSDILVHPQNERTREFLNHFIVH